MAIDYDWDSIKQEYITTKISYRAISKKCGVSFNTLKGRAIRENWLEKRKEFAGIVVEKTYNKLATKMSSKLANAFEKELLAADLINDLILETLQQDSQQFKKHLVQRKEKTVKGFSQKEKQWVEEKLFTVIDSKRLKDLADTLSTATGLKRLLQGVLSETERQKMLLERERLDLDKKKSNLYDSEEEDVTGIVILPEVNMSLTDNAIIEEEKTIDTGYNPTGGDPA